MNTQLDSAFLFENEEVRESIIKAIIIAAGSLSEKQRVLFLFPNGQSGLFDRSIIFKEMKTWRLLETLSILSILNRADEIKYREIPNLFRKFGPFEFIEGGVQKFLWYQPQFSNGIAGLKAIPDIAITDSREQANNRNILNIIECKHRIKMGAPAIRAEFGKAHDLRVLSYLIWTWWTPKKTLIQGAKKLGIDLVPVGFDSDLKKEFIEQPHSLFNHVLGEITRSRTENSFAMTIRKTEEEIEKKLKLLR
ncbi:MAG: hypothetical protein Q8N56_01490 [bacterium]|nr:hypothetical protein [bacterium]